MPTDWPALLPELQADAQAGMTVRAIAAKRGLPFGSVSRWLRKAAKSDSVAQDTSESVTRDSIATLTQVRTGKSVKVKEVVGSEVSPPEIEAIDKPAARRMMNQAIRGEIELDAQQGQMIKTALKDELEPEAESNPYAGTAEEELAERSLVLACSVLGYASVVARLRMMARAEPGLLDLLGDEEAAPPETLELDTPLVMGAGDDGAAESRMGSSSAQPIPQSLVSGKVQEIVRRSPDLVVEDIGVLGVE